jgi:hypothetical protein
MPIWRVKDSTLNSPTESNDLPTSKKRNSGSILGLEDQLVLSSKFEIGFKVEKSKDGGVKSFDLLHVGYQKPK